jgi:hypothetical protein
MYVTFRKIKNEVIAIFPTEKWTYNTLASYMHVGQHGGCTLFFKDFKKCKEKDYLPLLQELKSIGYNDLIIV